MYAIEIKHCSSENLYDKANKKVNQGRIKSAFFRQSSDKVIIDNSGGRSD
jgi:hypothetical protein